MRRFGLEVGNHYERRFDSGVSSGGILFAIAVLCRIKGGKIVVGALPVVK